MTAERSNAREKILAAANTVVLRDGATGLTLDKVAMEAGISKGGLLYHFPSKDALLRGMIEIMIADFEASALSRMADDPVKTGRFLRAYLVEAASPKEEGTPRERRKRLKSALVAAVANDQQLIDPLRERQKLYQTQIENDGIDPVDATIIRLVADGIWLSGVFDLETGNEDLQAKVFERLLQLSYGKVKGRKK